MNKNLSVFIADPVFDHKGISTVIPLGAGLVGAYLKKKIPALNILEPGSDAVTFYKDLSPNIDEILIEKKFASAFFQTSLIKTLHKLQADSIVITGVTTSGCVRATAVDSLQNNFLTTIAEDCVGDRDLDAHKANLFDLQAKYSDVVHSNLILK